MDVVHSQRSSIKSNIFFTAFRKSVLISLIVFCSLFLFYTFVDSNFGESEIAEGRTTVKTVTPFSYLVAFLNTGNYNSLVSSRPVFPILLTSFFTTLLISLPAFFLTVLISAIVTFFVITSRTEKVTVFIRRLNFFLYVFPSSIFVLITILVFSFWLNWFPSSYQMLEFSPNLFYPIIILALLFSFLMLFYIFSYLTETKVEEIQFRIRLHHLSIARTIKFMLFHEKNFIQFLFLIFLPLILTGYLFLEILFSIPGLSRVLFDALKNHDFPVILFLVPCFSFLYSLIFYLTNSDLTADS